MKKIYSTTAFTMLGSVALAGEGSTDTVFSFHGILLGVIITLTLVLLLVVVTLQKVVNMLQQEASGGKYVWEDERGFWEKLLSLKPLAAEKEVELDHDYDGIKELNNPIPPWFNVLFYGTIIFGFFYLVVYHVSEMAPLQAKEYETELQVAEQQKEAFLKKAGNAIDETNVQMITDAGKLAEGGNIYQSRCAACHGEKGEGKVGPNLTDAYWLHGGSIQDVFKTIKYGVPAKGMVSWQNSLNPMQLQQVASYVMSLQGSSPSGGKEPQGELYNPVGSATPASPSDSTTTDSNAIATTEKK
jgi:cytochrome c oxidase cbb3-type subunit III